MNLYEQNILDHYRHPRNYGKLNKCEHSCRQINRSCGDDLTVFVKLSGEVISKIKFIGQGCAISQAAISILSEELLGKTREETLSYNFDDIKKLLGVPISERRYNCAMLGLQAIQKSL